MADGHIVLQWQPVTEGLLDATCARLLDTVRSRGVRRLVVDGLGGMVRLAPYPDRVVHIFAALANELRALGVGSLFTTETDDMIVTEGQTSVLPPANVVSIAENVMFLRYVAVRSELTRLLSVLKVRDAKVDTRLRAYEMTQAGLVMDSSPARAEAIMTEINEPAVRRRRATAPGAARSTRSA